MDKPLPGMETMPYGLPLMLDAWASCVVWAAGKSEIVAKFEQETGRSVKDRTPENAAAWADFVTTHIWGKEEKDKT